MKQERVPFLLRHVGIALLGPFALLAVGFAGVFFWTAATWTGRGAAVALALIVIDLFLLISYGLPRGFERRRRLLWNAAGLLALTLSGALLAQAPSGRGGDAALVAEHVYRADNEGFRPYILSNLVPEVDQVGFGIGLAGWLDPLVSPAQALRLRQTCLPLYRAMRADPALGDLGSVLCFAYADIKGERPAAGHYLALVPRRRIPGRCPAVVFLHGSGGNFGAYWTALAALARQHGIAVLCPSFGFGQWARPGGVECVLETVAHAGARYALDPSDTYLLALSNGGTGATRAMAAAPRLFRGVIFLSAVLEQEALRQGTVAGAWKEKPVLILHGGADRRVPLGNIRRRLQELKRAEAVLTTWLPEAEDHFLFFQQRDDVLRRVVEWMRQTAPAAATPVAAGAPAPPAEKPSP